MSVIFEGSSNDTVVNLASLKASWPISERFAGIVTFVIAACIKACAPILLTPLGMAYSPARPLGSASNAVLSLFTKMPFASDE